MTLAHSTLPAARHSLDPSCSKALTRCLLPWRRVRQKTPTRTAVLGHMKPERYRLSISSTWPGGHLSASLSLSLSLSLFQVGTGWVWSSVLFCVYRERDALECADLRYHETFRLDRQRDRQRYRQRDRETERETDETFTLAPRMCLHMDALQSGRSTDHHRQSLREMGLYEPHLIVCSSLVVHRTS